jgi:hypothetical protein
VSFLLDTDTCIYWLKGNKRIERKAMANGLETLMTPTFLLPHARWLTILYG